MEHQTGHPNYLPKSLFHDNSFSLSQYLFDIFGGISYWFTSALVVSQLALAILFYIIKNKSIWVYFLSGIALFFIGTYGNISRTGNTPEDFFPWFYLTGMEYSFIMILGGIYAYYEVKVDTFINQYRLPFMVIGMSIYITYLFNIEQFRMIGLGGLWNLQGLLCICATTLMLVTLCKRFDSNKIFDFISKNSIIFYFLSGTFPALWATVAHKLFDNTSYFIALGVITLSLLSSFIATICINRYIPFVKDIRILKLHYK